jgi:hypothetical protein
MSLNSLHEAIQEQLNSPEHKQLHEAAERLQDIADDQQLQEDNQDKD